MTTESVELASRGPATTVRRRRSALGPTPHQTAVRYAVLAVVLLVSLFPIIWLVFTSLRTPKDIIAPSTNLMSPLTAENYITVFANYSFGSYLTNTVVVTFTTVALVTILAIPAAYALLRFKLPGQRIIFGVLLLVRMIPVIALAIPLFEIFAQIQLLDTWWALILAQTAAKLPVAIWLLLGFMESIPNEIEESAAVDGAGTLRTLVQIVAPLAAPGIAASAVLTFIFTWNDLLISLTLTSSLASQTLPVGLTNFVDQFGIQWGPMASAGVLMIVPTIIFVGVAQKHLVNGLVMGAVK